MFPPCKGGPSGPPWCASVPSALVQAVAADHLTRPKYFTAIPFRLRIDLNAPDYLQAERQGNRSHLRTRNASVGSAARRMRHYFVQERVCARRRLRLLPRDEIGRASCREGE